MPRLKHPNADVLVDVTDERARFLVDERGYVDLTGEIVAEEKAEDAPSEAPNKSAKRDEWDAYARSQGIDPDEHKTKDDLIAAVEAA